VSREQTHRAAIRDAGGDVRPLPWVCALREQAAKLVEGRRWLAQDGVRVVVDQRDLVQYFSK
jgi:hypothetical protein